MSDPSFLWKHAKNSIAGSLPRQLYFNRLAETVWRRYSLLKFYVYILLDKLNKSLDKENWVMFKILNKEVQFCETAAQFTILKNPAILCF